MHLAIQGSGWVTKKSMCKNQWWKIHWLIILNDSYTVPFLLLLGEVFNMLYTPKTHIHPYWPFQSQASIQWTKQMQGSHFLMILISDQKGHTWILTPCQQVPKLKVKAIKPSQFSLTLSPNKVLDFSVCPLELPKILFWRLALFQLHDVGINRNYPLWQYHKTLAEETLCRFRTE